MTSARDRLDAILDRLAARREDERVFLKLYEEQARDAAAAAEARRRAGLSLGPLDGAAVSIKDLFDVAGETTTAGSLVLRDEPPAPADAPVVRRLRQAGAVIVGKTNMVEFAFSGLGLNPHYGTPGNARDPARIPGGSSSGAGVSVAEGTSAISIGSDTGGSVRIPAALNGIVGFKPSARRVPLEGAFPLSYSLDSVGPLAASVQACADADAVMAGEAPAPLEAFPVAGLRIAVPRGRLFEDTEPAVAAAFEAALSRLSAGGARVVERPVEDLLQGMADATARASIASVEAAAIHAPWLERKAALYDPRVRDRIALSGAVPAPAYILMMRRRAALIRAMDVAMAPFDAVALPSVAVTAPQIAPLLVDDALYTRMNLRVLRNTMVANQFDLTSLSLPLPVAGLPVGLMLMARNGEDRRLLAIGAGIEALLRA
ncbi:MAG TPA: amidase [Microvirga sp.]|jgi:aspartyl-tRNA(Asn)/glutamyl-tRNA(Gln) amidotransferase subunit A|nr:amidase [Microvirga sp.]